MDDQNKTRDLEQVRLDKLAGIRAMGLNPYPYRFDVTAKAKDLLVTYAELPAGEVTGITVRVAGRIASMRNSGMFIDLTDTSEKIQVFSHKDSLSEQDLNLLALFDLGDLIGVEGIVRRTPRGELTINAHHLTMLAKTLLQPPEKYHGLTDVDTRYRQRYLDLIANEESRETLRKRSRIVTFIRQFLIGEGFLEVETPMLHPIPGGAMAKPFMTHHNALDMDLYLRIAPELYLKRLIVGGLADKVFEINRNFRNEGLSPRHNPEFTMLELYWAYADYLDIRQLVENLVSGAAQEAQGTTDIEVGKHVIKFGGQWRSASMCELIQEKTGLDFLAMQTAEEARAAAKAIKCEITGIESWGKVVEIVFGERVEASLIQPVHVMDYPRDISPLAKAHRDDPRLSERFETFVNGIEIANAFSELTDPHDQLARFEEQVQNREKGDDEAQYLDRDYVTALEYGLPPTGGLGIGIDRLIMLLTNSSAIRDVIAFPTMRPKH